MPHPSAPLTFKRQPDHELDQLDDDKLIVYLRNASKAGDTAGARRALAILVYGYARNVQQRMALRVPPWAVEDATHDVLVRAVASAFNGTSEGEFRSWLGTITDRTAADWYRTRSRRPVEAQLPSEHSEDSGSWDVEPSSESAAGAVELQILIDAVMAELSAPHRSVIELHVFEGRAAPEVCQQIDGMTVDNVAQVASRFRKRMRDALESADRGVAQ